MPSPRSLLSGFLLRTWCLLALALGIASPASAQAPGTWAPIADLNQPRAQHTATLLQNGTRPRPTHRHAAARRARPAGWWNGRCGAAGVPGNLRPDHANVLAGAERARGRAPRPYGHAPSGRAGPRGGRLRFLWRPRVRRTLRPDGRHRQPGGAAQRPPHAGEGRAPPGPPRARGRPPDGDGPGPGPRPKHPRPPD